MLILVNVDDVPGELLPHVIDGLMARGAKNVHAAQSLTKKGRLGYMIFIDAPSGAVDELGSFLASEVGTIGMRILETRHVCFDYGIRRFRVRVPGDGGAPDPVVRVKSVYDGDGKIVSVKAEYEDLTATLAQLQGSGVDISLLALKRLVEGCAAGQSEVVRTDVKIEMVGEDPT